MESTAPELPDEKDRKGWKQRLLDAMRKAYRWGDEKVPPGLRLVFGLLLIVGGVFGFLPVLGFWMIPLGGVIAALDIPPLRRRLRRLLKPNPPDASGPDGG